MYSKVFLIQNSSFQETVKTIFNRKKISYAYILSSGMVYQCIIEKNHVLNDPKAAIMSYVLVPQSRDIC